MSLLKWGVLVAAKGTEMSLSAALRVYQTCRYVLGFIDKYARFMYFTMEVFMVAE